MTEPLLRELSAINDPPAHYDFYNYAASVRIRYGGKIIHSPDPVYLGGSTSAYDHVGPIHYTIHGMNALCENAGIKGKKTFYVDDDQLGYKLVAKDEDLKLAFLDVYRSLEVRWFDLYVIVDRGRGNDGGESDVDSDADLEQFDESEYEALSDNDVAIALGAEENEVENDDGNEEEVEEANDRTENVAHNEEDDQRNRVSDENSVEEGLGDEDIVVSGDELNSDRDSDDECKGRVKLTTFNVADVMNPTFHVGMKFPTKQLFREAVQSHAINTCRRLKITKNDKMRIYAKCWGGLDCDWRLHVVKLPDEETYIVREYHKSHKCLICQVLPNVKSRWLAKRFLHLFKTDPRRNVEGWKLDAINQIIVDVSKQQAYRARAHAFRMLYGDPLEQYGMLWDYVEEVKRTNPGSTLIVGTDNSTGFPVFDRFYVCLDALKKGFNSGCRPVIGIDGCHLKGPYGGVLLTAVGVDPNNNTFPIAWAAVDKETGDCWEWFLELLRKDLGIVKVADYTIMSDKQKGLIQAVNSIFPGCEHRFCVRHLHGNFKSAGFTGEVYKQALWKAAKACTEQEWADAMNEMEVVDKLARRWFADKPAHQWSKSQFRTHPKCDILLNNGCECFNACILEARGMGILSMMEWLMEYAMKRMRKNRERAQKWTEELCPKIKAIIVNNMKNIKDVYPVKSSDKDFEVHSYSTGGRYKVDLKNSKCGCRHWDLSGIPCVHALRAIGAHGLKVENYVHKCYRVDAYNNVYSHVVMPTNGRKLWKKSTLPAPIPPPLAVTKQVGRPKGGARRPEPDERVVKTKRKCRGKPIGSTNSKSGCLKKIQRTCKCKFCGEVGHNTKGCQKRKEADANRLSNCTDAPNEPNPHAQEDNELVRGVEQLDEVNFQTVLNDGGEPGMFSQLPSQEALGDDVGPSRKKLPVRRTGKQKASTKSAPMENLNAPFKPPSATKQPAKGTSFQEMLIEETSVGSKTPATTAPFPSFADMEPEETLSTRRPVILTNPSALQQLLQGGSVGSVGQIGGPVNIHGSSIRVSMGQRSSVPSGSKASAPKKKSKK